MGSWTGSTHLHNRLVRGGLGEEERATSYESLLLPGSDPAAPALLLLHGSNGGERDLLGLAGGIAPGAARLALRGDVAMRPGFAFFKRFPDRRIDVEDLRSRTARLARFIRLASERAGSHAKPVALGYSNGAVMATALLLDAPGTLAGAILLRPLLPFEPSGRHLLSGLPVLIIDGLDDARRAPGDGLLVAEALRRAGAVVRHETSRSGHAVGPDDVRIARAWVGRLEPSG